MVKMSDFLLQKSIKLIQQSKPIKKKKSSEVKKLKRKHFLNKILSEDKEIERNLKYLQQLNKQSAVIIPEEVLSRCSNYSEKNKTDSEELEEPTAFTEKDFEDFEKEYFE